MLSGDKKTKGTVAEMHGAEDTQLMEAPLTVGEKISSGFWLGGLALGAVCFVFTVYELWPSQTSPNAVFDQAFSQIRKNDEVVAAFGEPMKAYGIDHGGNREGRRNFIMSRETEGEDGSKRLKVRFNLEGKYAGGVVFAEVSDKLNVDNGEWVYLIVQSKKTGATYTICDNRSVIGALASAKSEEEKESIRRLLKASSSY